MAVREFRTPRSGWRWHVPARGRRAADSAPRVRRPGRRTVRDPASGTPVAACLTRLAGASNSSASTWVDAAPERTASAPPTIRYLPSQTAPSGVCGCGQAPPFAQQKGAAPAPIDQGARQDGANRSPRCKLCVERSGPRFVGQVFGSANDRKQDAQRVDRRVLLIGAEEIRREPQQAGCRAMGMVADQPRRVGAESRAFSRCVSGGCSAPLQSRPPTGTS